MRFRHEKASVILNSSHLSALYLRVPSKTKEACVDLVQKIGTRTLYFLLKWRIVAGMEVTGFAMSVHPLLPAADWMIVMRAPRTDSSLNRWNDEGGAPNVPRSSRIRRSASPPQATSALYYFNIRSDHTLNSRSDRTLIEDPEGLTLPDLKAALQEALAIARHSLTEGNRQGENRRNWRVEIMDRANEHLMTVAFNEVYSCEWSRGSRGPDWASHPVPLVRTMEQRLSVISLGVRNLSRSRTFYERLGWQRSMRSTEEVVFFQLGGIVLSLLPREMLAREANLPEHGSGFGGVALAYNTRSRAEVEMVLNEAEAAGARVVKAAQSSAWGGYSGYFADPDDYLWEVAWNPGFDLADDGRVTLPQ